MSAAHQANVKNQVAAPPAIEAYRLHVNLDAASYVLLGEAQDLLSHKLPQGDVGGVIGMALAALVERLQRRKHGRRKGRNACRPITQTSAATDTDRPAPQTGAAINTEAEPKDSKSAHNASLRNEPSEQGARTTNAPSAQEALPRRSDSPVKAGRSRTLSRAVKRNVYERDAGTCTYVAANGHRCGARENRRAVSMLSPRLRRRSRALSSSATRSAFAVVYFRGAAPFIIFSSANREAGRAPAQTWPLQDLLA